MIETLRPLVGILTIVTLAYFFSNDRKNISWRTVLVGLGMGFFIMFFTLKVPIGKQIFQSIGVGVSSLIHFGNKGSEFVFGDLAKSTKIGFVFAFQVMPNIIFFTVLVGLGYYFKIIPRVISVMGFVLQKTLKINGSQAVVGSTNSFSGMIESGLIVKNYIPNMNSSEIHALMAIGLSTISSEMLLPLASLNVPVDLMLTSSAVAAPVSIAIANLLFPNPSVVPDKISITKGSEDQTLLNTIMNSIDEGIKVVVGIVGTLLVFVALVYMLDGMLAVLGNQFGFSITISQILGYVFTPFSWLIGIPLEDIGQISTLLGKKVIFNEFIAYIDLMAIKDTLNEKSFKIAAIALCSFSNISACAITLGGFNKISPRKEYSVYIVRALFSAIVTFLVVSAMAAFML